MHIYRLAMAFNLMKARYVDAKTRLASLTPEERRKEEAEILRRIPSDDAQWGSWNEKIHKHWSQKERQSRAYEIEYDKENIVDKERLCGIISFYQTTLSSCTCPDFEDRKLPCKHIYCLAHLLNIPLLVTREAFDEQRKNIQGNLAPMISIGYKDGKIFVKHHTSEE